MEQAWLDSLSEDWVSQPGSSGSPAGSLPSLPNSTPASECANISAASSRIPKYNPQKHSWIATSHRSSNPLSERSPNNNNIPSQRVFRRPSNLGADILHSKTDRHLSRTTSSSTTQSTQCHTLQHNSVNVSPKRASHETPEWKRRLLHGEVGYGEQRDLFSPAGLETIFRPPPPNKSPARDCEEESATMSSSPPAYNSAHGSIEELHRQTTFKEEDNQSRGQPRVMKYKLADQSGSDFSANDLSRSSSFRPVMATSQSGSQEQYSDSDPCLGSSGGKHKGIMAEAERAVSGQSDIRNEELSPIYITRHNTVNRKTNSATVDLPAAELQKRLADLQTTEDPDSASQLLPGDVTFETDDYAHNGQFVNLRRGGYSQEGSFQTRMLSPSSLPAIDESALPEESMQASTPKHLPTIKKTRSSNDAAGHDPANVSPSVMPVPHPSPIKINDHGHKSSSGSPLKLFGTYDTFTNQKLLRRLSQFEGHSDGDEVAENPSSSALEASRRGVNEAVVAPSATEKEFQANRIHKQPARKLNSFGDGMLDSFQFNEEISYDSSRSIVQGQGNENILLNVLDSGTQIKLTPLAPPPPLRDSVTQRRSKHTDTTSATKDTIAVRKKVRPDTADSDTATLPTSKIVEDLGTPRKRNGGSEGKRLPGSPFKDPTPKRRRTLHKSDIDRANVHDEVFEQDSLRETHQQMQFVIGRKRKDAKHGDDQRAANPNVLAMRQMLRPRTPTPSQRSSQQREHAPFLDIHGTSIERARTLREQKIASIQAELDSTDPLKASIVLSMSQQMCNDSRKGSVTTQDFLDEAKKIMAGIRGKARPRSGLASLEESESENDRNVSIGTTEHDDDVEDSTQESTKEPFSRPPSREGRPIPRIPLKQEDPDLLDHLRKYEETSDKDGIIASSMKSISLAKDAVNAAKEAGRLAEETITRAASRKLSKPNIFESEPPNIRITENPDLQRKRKHSASSAPNGAEEQQEAEFPSHGSNSSSSQSTSRSIPTGSSRGSESRIVIAPESVSHLIPELLAGMVFDRERNIWIKRKAVDGGTGGRDFVDETDDDPFGDIPDLSVDETQELQRIKAVAARRQEESRVEHTKYNEVHEANLDHNLETRKTFVSESVNIGVDSEDVSSSDPSKLTRLASSCTGPETNTRLSSWGDEQAPKATLHKPEPNQDVYVTHTSTKIVREDIIEEVEREISIHEDRVDPKSTRRRRNITISFSSPLASIIQPAPYYDEASSLAEADEGASDNDSMEESEDGSVIVTKGGNNQDNSSTKMRSGFRSTSRRLSLGGHKFAARPVSRIDEQDEDSFSRADHGPNQRSISVVVSTPLSKRVSSVVLATPRQTHEIGTLDLTPLSDFTIHQRDESFGLEVSYIARGQRYVPGSGSKRTLSLSIKELVEKLTEVEPYEPFWEHIKQMDLRDKQLTSLHKLEEFCEQLEELDVSNNQISHLHGAPRAIRHLRITHNYLSDLTAWGHLINLQYIDVSNNELESLSGFKYLVHLRGLRADNNKIKSLSGIDHLDGLLTLRLRGNLIDALDFGGSRLQRLTELDVKDNHVHDVQNIQELRSLSSLNLEDNDLSNLTLVGSELLWALKYLKLSGNNLESLNVSQYPNLRLLYLDRNRLGNITGLLRAKHLDSLSMREQQDGAIIDPSFLSEAFEIRKLFLSGNLLNGFKPQVDFLNLQYLELANCGLESLPVEFGQMVSNTRVLNLNFNALRDIKPILGIVRLKKLHLAGNRLSRLRKTTNVLAQFPSLTLVDLRNNPLTLGFYPPMVEMRLVVRDVPELDESIDTAPFTLGKADRGRDVKYSARLDMETRMLRRVFEMLLLGACTKLKNLDGLDVDRRVLGAKDKVWEALERTGVVIGTLDGMAHEKNHQEMDLSDDPTKQGLSEAETVERSIPEERWEAEDSFA